MFGTLLNLFWDLLFPPTCVRCGREGSWCCTRCAALLPHGLVQWCPRCGAVDEGHAMHDFAFNAVLSFLPFQEAWVERMLHATKYGGVFSYATFLGTLLAQRLRARGLIDGEITVTDVPLFPRRERSRGFNQARCIAQGCANTLGLPYRPLLRRTRQTGTQTALSAEERLRNVAGAFAPRMDKRDGFVVPTKRVILVDDVVTTGATLSEASSVLRAGGADHITVLTVAHSVPLFVKNR